MAFEKEVRKSVLLAPCIIKGTCYNYLEGELWHGKIDCTFIKRDCTRGREA